MVGTVPESNVERILSIEGMHGIEVIVILLDIIIIPEWAGLFDGDWLI